MRKLKKGVSLIILKIQVLKIKIKTAKIMISPSGKRGKGCVTPLRKEMGNFGYGFATT